jgi:sugar/nucleoside kinase (ribokinase family)
MVVSLDSRGAYGFSRGRWSYAPAPKVQARSTAGAGDALLGGLIFALVSGRPLIPDADTADNLTGEINSALQFGVLLASYKVLSPHSIHPDASLQNLSALASTLGQSVHPALGMMAHMAYEPVVEKL